MKRFVVAMIGLGMIAVPVDAGAATLFADGFESGSFAAWSASAGLVIETGDARSGIRAAGNNGTSNAWARAVWPTAETDLYARAFVKLYSSSTAVRLLRFRTSTGGPIARLYLTSVRRLAIRNDVAGINRVSTITVTTGEWHEVELRAGVNGVSGAIEVWYDGVRVAGLSGTQNLGTAPIRQLELGNPVAGSSYDLEFDDVAVAEERVGGGQVGPPSITTFAPTSGAPGTVATVTGTDFTGASAVTFNGTPSVFAVDSDSSLSATVPAGASTGPIRVTTPAGSAVGPTNFTVTGTAETLRVVVAGDICQNSTSSLTKCTQTGDRVSAEAPDWVLVAGDIAYPAGTANDFATRYHTRWGGGNDPSFLSITRPVPGNHEYDDPANGNGAEGYRSYFPDDVAPASGPLYYSWGDGDWHFVALDTDACSPSEGCPGIGAGSVQLAFLQADLAADPHTCEIAYGHHPRWSSPSGTGATSRHGSQGNMQAAWQILVDQGVDLYISGHDHDYERFAPMDGGGAGDPVGTRQFVVGTGGAGLYPFATILPTSEAHILDHGILILTLDSHVVLLEVHRRVRDHARFRGTGSLPLTTTLSPRRASRRCSGGCPGSDPPWGRSSRTRTPETTCPSAPTRRSASPDG